MPGCCGATAGAAGGACAGAAGLGEESAGDLATGKASEGAPGMEGEGLSDALLGLLEVAGEPAEDVEDESAAGDGGLPDQ